MPNHFRKFLVQSAVISGVLYVVWPLLFFLIPGSYLSPALPVMIPFFFVVTAGVYYIMLQSAANRFPRFVNSFMMMTFGKILLYVVAIMIYVLLNKADAFPFVAAFFILYLIFTVYEVTAFLRDTKSMGRN